MARKSLTPELETSLSIHDYTMDGETAGYLHRMHGVMALIRDRTDSLGTGDPLPESVQTSLWVVDELLREAMMRGGLIEKNRPPAFHNAPLENDHGK